jgi:hypothetical protein
VIRKETQECFARFAIFSSKLQMYIRLHIVRMNELGWIVPPNSPVVLVDEILEDDNSPLYMDPSNRTHSNIPNQQDNTSLHRINYCLTFTSFFIEKKNRLAEQQPYFLRVNTFRWPRKLYVCISNRLIKYSCIVCTTFPPNPTQI